MLGHRILIARGSFFVTLVCLLWAAAPLQAQSLSSQLKQESMEKLATDARGQGDPIRGAILFNRKSIECGRCHASGGDQPLGPDLSLLFKTSDDRQLIESILDPDKVIKEGFESVTVATIDGRVITGRLVAETDDRVIIRDATAAGTAITIPRDDVEEIAPSKRSLMPNDLVDQLADRQQFLDLVAYVIQVAEQGPALPNDMASTTIRESLADELQGRVLFDRYRCQACHSNTFDSLHDSQVIAPSLQWAGRNLNPDYLLSFILDPRATHSQTLMPNLMGGLSKNERASIAEALVQFIVSPEAQPHTAPSIDNDAAQRGRELYHTIGCVACHTPFDNQGKARFDDPFAAMGPLSRKYNLASLIEFLENPHRARPSGRMPDMELTHWEAIDLANYLLQRDKPNTETTNEWKTLERDSNLIAAGEDWFQKLSCVRCHEPPSTTVTNGRGYGLAAREPLPAIPITTADAGCLSNLAGKWPQYDLSDEERRLIGTAIEAREQAIDDEEALELRLSALNCTACHQRNGLGGVAQRLDEYFKTTDQNLGQQGRIPPTLDLVGAKLQPDWMREVLVSHRSIRPYMQTRMPQFNVDDVADLIDRFQSLDQVTPVDEPKEIDDKIIREAGLQLVGNQGLNCIACHTYRFEKSDTMPAVDLTEMSARLKYDWFVNYMRAPQRFSPNTVMPSFWPAGHAVRTDILEGDADQQIQAIWRYLLEGRDARAPRGVVREPIELLASDEAIMLRRSYPGIGKRGIGVGYPGQLNLAFDAEQMRLGMIWKGPFAEASGVFRGQGSGNVNPLGKDRIEFAKGPELDNAEEPWIVDEGRPPLHHFEGYTLDALQRPTFMYRYEKVQVRDFSFVGDSLQAAEATAISGLSDSPKVLVREITFKTTEDRNDLAFRIAADVDIKKLDDHLFQIGRQLVVHVDDRFSVELIADDASQKLLVKLNLTDKPTTLVLRYIW